MRRYAGPGIIALLGIGLQLTGFQAPWLGVACLAIAGSWTLALLVWPVLSRRFPYTLARKTSFEQSDLRAAVQGVRRELTYMIPLVQRALDTGQTLSQLLPNEEWARCRGILGAVAGIEDVHDIVYRAYVEADNLNKQSDFDRGVFLEALNSIVTAEANLEVVRDNLRNGRFLGPKWQEKAYRQFPRHR